MISFVCLSVSNFKFYKLVNAAFCVNKSLYFCDFLSQIFVVARYDCIPA